MLTWHLDRLLRTGSWAALATLILPASLAVLVARVSEVDKVLGIMLVAAGVMLIGTMAGSSLTSGIGVLLFGVGAVSAQVSPWLLLVVGLGLYATLVVHDLAGTFRRAPRINQSLWRSAGQTVGSVGLSSLVGFALAYLPATRTTWAAIVVPFAVAAIGLAAKLAADVHRSRTRQAAKRP